MMKGTIEVRKVPCPWLKGNPLGDEVERATPVYVPSGYATSKVRYPVVYFLHGFAGSGLQWLNQSAFTDNVPQRLDSLIEEKQIPPVIGVFVDGWTAIGGHQWLNSEAIGRYRDALVKDLVPFVDKNFRTLPEADARAVIGKSSGGFGAFVVGRHHPQMFAHIGSHSGDAGFEYCYLSDFPRAANALLKAGGPEKWLPEFYARARQTAMRADDHLVINFLCMSAAYSPKKGVFLNAELPIELETGRLKIEVWNRWLVNDPVRFIPKNLAAYQKLKSIFFDCGERDEFGLRWGNRMIAEELKAGKVSFEHQEFDDGHRNINYRFEASLRYLVPRLKSDTALA
jgi:S-formylglutathione hydrolase FrmB